MDAAGEILGKRACQDHLHARLKRLVSQNVLLKNAAPQMHGTLQACRELHTHEEAAVPEGSN